MSLGVLGRAQVRVLSRRPIGAITSNGVVSSAGTLTLSGKTWKSRISWWCWDQPKFKDCHALAFGQAQRECAAANLQDDLDCIGPATDSIATQNCACPESEPVTSAAMDPKVLLFGAVAIAALMMMGGDEKRT